VDLRQGQTDHSRLGPERAKQPQMRRVEVGYRPDKQQFFIMIPAASARPNT